MASFYFGQPLVQHKPNFGVFFFSGISKEAVDLGQGKGMVRLLSRLPVFRPA